MFALTAAGGFIVGVVLLTVLCISDSVPVE